jgi:hypothetical protein
MMPAPVQLGEYGVAVARHAAGRRARQGHARCSGSPSRAAFGGAASSRLMPSSALLGLSRQKARPSHPEKDPAAQAAFTPALLRKIQCTHENKHIRLFFQDEARIGQKGRTCHIWWEGGQRPAPTRALRQALHIRLHLCLHRARYRPVSPSFCPTPTPRRCNSFSSNYSRDSGLSP